MKKINIQYIVLALCTTICLSSCYDDKSTLSVNLIDDVVIDTTGISVNQYVGYQEVLHLVPDIGLESGQDSERRLAYEWALNETVGSTQYEVLSRDKEFHEIIARPIDVSYYLLKLTVTDTQNDNLQYFHTWKVYVQSSFIDGLLISDSKDGQTSDFTFIKNKTFTLDYDKEEAIYRQILENANGNPYNGLLSSLTYEVFGYPEMDSRLNQVWAITHQGDEAVRFDCEDFSINGSTDNEFIITYKPEGLQFKSFFSAYQLFFAHTSSGFYNLSRVSANSFGWHDATSAGYKPHNDVIAANSSRAVVYNYLVWYDKEKEQFVSYTGNPTFGTAKLHFYAKNNIFDPNALPNQSAVAAGILADAGIATFLLKDDATGTYTIYTLNQFREQQGYWNEDYTEYTETSPEVPATAGNRYAIPASGKSLLDNAVSVFFLQNVNLLFVTTDNGIYTITYGIGDTAVVSTTPKYTAAAGETITKAKLYQQGDATNDMSIILPSRSEPPYRKTLPWHNKAVIVSTQKSESEGKVYVIPITQTGIGTLDPSKALAYDGFGKVLDVITIGY